MMEKLGISVTNADGSMKDSAKIQEELHDAFSKLSESEQIAAASAIFGKNQMAPWLALINTAPGDVNALSGALENCGGVTQEMADTMMSGFGGSLEKLKSSADVLVTSLGQALAPTIQKVVDFVQGLVDKFNALTPEQQEQIAQIGLLVAAIGPVIVLIGKVISGVGSIITIGGSLMTALGALCSPIGLVVAAIGGAIAAGVALYKNWDEIKAWASEKWGAIKDAVSGKVDAAKAKVSETWESIQTKTSAAWDSVKSRTSEKWEDVKGKVSAAADAAKSKVEVAWDAVKAKTSSAWESIQSGTAEKWDGIKGKVSEAVGEAKSKVEVAWNAVKTKTSTAWEGAKSVVTEKVGGMVSTISSKFTAAKDTVSNIFDSIRSAISDKLNSAKNTVSNAIDKIKSFFKFEWSLPKLKMPHFSITGKFSLNPPSVPHIGVDWYRKAMGDAMVLDNATIFGAAGGRFLGGGEAGREVVSGEAHLLDLIHATVDGAIGARMDSVLALLEQYLPGCAQTKVAVPVSSIDRALAASTARRQGAW